MTRVAILTPDPADAARAGRWREVFERMAGPLGEAGATVAGPPWTRAGDLAAYDLVLPLVAWGYHRAGPRWADQVQAWERAGARLRNPASVLRWNADKRHLGRLAEQGAPVVPTLYAPRLTAETMAEAARAFGTERLVAKPQVSASAYRTLRWRPGGSLEGGPEGPALVQPYLPSIETQGEASLFFLGGRFSHAVRKVPQPGTSASSPSTTG